MSIIIDPLHCPQNGGDSHEWRALNPNLLECVHCGAEQRDFSSVVEFAEPLSADTWADVKPRKSAK